MNQSGYDFRRLPLVSILLVAVNVIIFAICQFNEELYALWNQNVPDVVFDAQYGRLITAMFLHSDRYHIFNNMLILFFLGEMLEKEVGHFRFFVFYFLSGIGGNLISVFSKMLSSDWAPSIGASGAVFGLDGVLLALVLFSGRKLVNITPVRVLLMILLSLYNGFTGSNIDNAAHVGGLLTGFALASIYCILNRIKQQMRNKKRM